MYEGKNPPCSVNAIEGVSGKNIYLGGIQKKADSIHACTSWRVADGWSGHQQGYIAYEWNPPIANRLKSRIFDISEGYPLHDVQHLLLDLFQFVLHLYHDILHFRLVRLGAGCVDFPAHFLGDESQLFALSMTRSHGFAEIV